MIYLIKLIKTSKVVQFQYKNVPFALIIRNTTSYFLHSKQIISVTDKCKVKCTSVVKYTIFSRIRPNAGKFVETEPDYRRGEFPPLIKNSYFGFIYDKNI